MSDLEKAFEAADKMDRVKIVSEERAKRILESEGRYVAVPIFIPVRGRIETPGPETLVRLAWAALTPENINKTGEGEPVRNSYAQFPDEESALDSVFLFNFARRMRVEQAAFDALKEEDEDVELLAACGAKTDGEASEDSGSFTGAD